MPPSVTLRVVGLDDESPFMVLESWCSCGALVTRREVDVREVADDQVRREHWGEADGQAFLRHVAERHPE